MLLIILFILILIVGITIIRINDKLNRNIDIGVVTTIFSSIVLILALIVLPLARCSCTNSIIEFKEAQRVIENQRQRKDISEIEGAALTNKIIEYNTWLQKSKEMSKSKWVGIYYQKQVNELSPIE